MNAFKEAVEIVEREVFKLPPGRKTGSADALVAAIIRAAVERMQGEVKGCRCDVPPLPPRDGWAKEAIVVLQAGDIVTGLPGGPHEITGEKVSAVPIARSKLSLRKEQSK